MSIYGNMIDWGKEVDDLWDNHSNMLDSTRIQPTFLWQLLFLVEGTQLYCAHVVALSQLSQFLCYSLWHLGQILHGCGKAVPVVT